MYLGFNLQSRDIILRKPNKTTHDTGQIITSKSVNKENVVKLKRDEKPVMYMCIGHEKGTVWDVKWMEKRKEDDIGELLVCCDNGDIDKFEFNPSVSNISSRSIYILL